MADGAEQTNWLARWIAVLLAAAVLAAVPALAQEATDEPAQLTPGPTPLTPEQPPLVLELGETVPTPTPSPAGREAATDEPAALPEPAAVPEPQQAPQQLAVPEPRATPEPRQSATPPAASEPAQLAAPPSSSPPPASAAPTVGGVFLTSLARAPSQVKLCPAIDCPTMDEHPYGRVLTVAIYEAKDGWVRVSKYVGSDQLKARYPGVELPAQVAMWVPVDTLPSAVAALYPGAPKQVEKPAQPARLAALPGDVAVPTQRPAVGDVEPRAPEPDQPSESAAQSPADDDEREAVAAVDPSADDEQAQPEAPAEEEAEPAEPAAEEAEPAAQEPTGPPETLTAELKDKRLANLPLKPDDQISLKAIIALRYEALQLLESGECSGIREGGPSLSGPGWVYVTCEDDYQFRQFFVE